MQGLCGRTCQMLATSSFLKALPFRSFGPVALQLSPSYTLNLEFPFPLRRFHMESDKKSESGAFAILGSNDSRDLKCLSKGSSRQVHMESNNKSDSRGALIVLEGLDRCGKTSQCSRLLSYLEGLGHLVESWRFPDRNTGVGQMISSYLNNNTQLDDHAIHLLFSANRWEKRSLMESKLRSGTTLIVDRYSFSGVAFSTAKGLNMDWCKAPDIGLLAPDLVLYLDISPEKAAERGGYGGERYEQLEFQKKVALSYQKLFDGTWKVINATLPVEDVEKQLREIVKECILTCEKGKQPMLELWQN